MSGCSWCGSVARSKSSVPCRHGLMNGARARTFIVRTPFVNVNGSAGSQPASSATLNRARMCVGISV